MGMLLKFKLGKGAIGWLTGCITGAMVVSCWLVDATFSGAAAQSIACRGNMNNGWRYTADYRNGQFTRIRWSRSGQSPQSTTLTYSSTNAQGEPVYTGAFRANTAVTLVDLSRGYVRSGSQIAVHAEEWGWSTGTCGNRPIPGAW